ncbi:MAG: sugar ABC transporter ATP-binding protein, partial [Verrucomicrobiota bacterium]|nr:sugar ABC transporter ATP-binding protein [Verrucomicrobiota bacterium]
SKEAKIIIMDEPTSSLTISETDKLLKVISDLKNEGISIIYISHRLGEVSTCADRVVALRDGSNAGTLTKNEINHDNMVSLMVGRELERTSNESGSNIDISKGFEAKDLISSNYPNCKVSFKVFSGEILGMAGLVGAGRSEIAQTIFGVDPDLGGTIHIDGNPIKRGSAKASIKAGIYLAPEDRKRTGLITEFDIIKNVSLASLKNYSNRIGLIDSESEETTASNQINKLNIKTPSADTPVINLSGGNQQKVVLGKWLSMNPKLIIFDEPTRGIDVGAKAEIYKLMRKLADKGVAILMISSDMEEVLGISDRIAVMHEGKITGILDREKFSEENIMNLAVGRSS